MLKALSPFALLALAAAASAQTFVLQPADAKGYSQIGSVTLASASRANPSTINVPIRTSTSLVTGYAYKLVYYPAGVSHTVPEPYYYPARYEQTIDRRWWNASFALPATPTGMSLASATFSATVVGWKGQTVSFAVAAGSKSLAAAAGSFSADLTSLFRPLVDNGARSASLGASLAGYQSALSADILSWTSPKLTLIYGYPARTPLALGNFVGDATKVSVAYEVRKPGTKEIVVSGTLASDASGRVFPLVPPGTYDVSLKASHWLRRTLRNVVVTDASSALPAVALVNGDVNGDNVVSAADRAKVTAALGSSRVDALYSDACDLTGDGYVTAKDRAIVTAALGSAGDE